MCDAEATDRVLDLLAAAPQTMDDLSDKTGLAHWRINKALCELLLAGRTAPVKMRVRGKNKIHYTLKVTE